MRAISTFVVAALASLALAGCDRQSAQTPQDSPASPADDVLAPVEPSTSDPDELPEVDPSLLNAPSAEFMAIEPSEVGIFAAPEIAEALEPLLAAGAHEEVGSVHFTVRSDGDIAVADVVRVNIPDDSVAGGHVRVEFRREPEGWFPTNAYRRTQCRRGDLAGQWTSALCP